MSKFSFIFTLVTILLIITQNGAADRRAKADTDTIEYTTCMGFDGNRYDPGETWHIQGRCVAQTCKKRRITWRHYTFDIAVPYEHRCYQSSNYFLKPQNYDCVNIPTDDAYPYPHCCDMTLCRSNTEIRFKVDSWVYWAREYVNRKATMGDYHMYY